MKISYQIHRRIRTSLLLFAVVLSGAVGMQLVDQALAKGDEQPAPTDGRRLMQIYDRGQERTIVTASRTVGEALQAAGVVVDAERDVVEPALQTELVSTKYQVNIYRARPVTVIDGQRRVRVTTAQQTPALIARAAGIVVYPEDVVDMTTTSNVVLVGADTVVAIQRANPVRLQLYGAAATVRTMARTVGDLLREKGVTLGANDTVSVPLIAPITTDMSIAVWRNGKQTVTVEESVAFPTETIRDANRPVGFREVKESGQAGKRKATYEIEMRDGKEVSRKEIASVMVAEPKKQVEVIGVKSEAPRYTGGGNKDQWLAASNIPRDQWGYVNSIIERESGWNPNATNPTSKACGLAQALPCSKVPGGGYDPVNSLRWAHGYVNGRYYHGSPYLRGSTMCQDASRGWECAYRFWRHNHWY